MSDTAAPGPNGEGQQAPSIVINAQYLRDLSFENPRAPDSLLQQSAAPEVGIDVDVKARQLGEETFEVVLVLKVQARTAGEVAFLVEVEYGGVVTIRGVSQDIMAALVLIETPRMLFPFARAIVADATRDGGFPPLLINPIDFTEVQRRKAAEAEAAAQAETAGNA
ncbi:protein-export protein SecB [Aliidongia dinghuensis]|uniref:Protein-export protein SecB n=1 Tax=Aliidongia dinghuensis TaxID=1867774 RepID=A0A8J2YX91_9PROT|nr:protein-export chaperone SecB [Aliidongia dinghuensis]GGF32643.1 protein-export protein SecB [Aliidongia dinghuensis]